MQSFYTNVQSNHGSIWVNCYLDNNQLLPSIFCLLCGRLSIYGGNDRTSVWTVSLHLIQIIFSADNMISLSLNNFKHNFMAVKYKGHRTAALNIEPIFVVLELCFIVYVRERYCNYHRKICNYFWFKILERSYSI